MYGKAADPHTWEFGYFYQVVEKDALFGQYIDSDWGAGNTDANGSVIKFGYAFAKNFTFNGWYHFANTNVDVPVVIPGVGTHLQPRLQAAAAGPEFQVLTLVQSANGAAASGPVRRSPLRSPAWLYSGLACLTLHSC